MQAVSFFPVYTRACSNKSDLGDNVDAFNWSCFEIATAIVCACLSTMRVLLSRVATTIFGIQQSPNTPPSGSAMLRSYHRKGLSRIEDTETPNESITEGSKEAQSLVSGTKAERSWPGSPEDTELLQIKI